MVKPILLSVTILILSLPAPGRAEEQVTQQFQGFNLQGYTDGGQKAWDVKGDTADILNDTIEITNVDANQYGEIDVNIKAREGIIHKTSGDIQLKKDVVIVSERGTRLTTDYLQWQKGKGLVSTEDQVVLTDRGLVASGKGLQAHPALKTATLDKEVTVKVNPEPDKPETETVTITCDGSLEIDQKANVAIFHDNVLAVQKDRTLKADQMNVYFNPETQKIVKVVCTGNVIILQGGNTTYADKAVYDAKEQKFILTGRPKLILVTEDGGGIAGFPE